jgi:membrane protease YdiL (CAAX protease family)
MNFARLRAVAFTFGLFLAVYIPAFAAVSLARPPIETAAPLIIAISLTIAIALIAALARRAGGPAEFGLRGANARYLFMALALGLPLALGAAWLAHVFPAKSPIDTSGFPAWMLWLTFGAGASVQEEVIFRGLIQSFLAQRWPATAAIPGAYLSPAVLFTGVLFGVIHLESGPVVAACAVVLGLLAGELRRRSGSLVPAVIVHALFNLPDLPWP